MTDRPEGTRLAQPDVSDLSFSRIAITLLRSRRVILSIAAVGALAGLVSGLVRDREYVSRVSFLPKGAEESASGLALAASQFGVTLPTKMGDWWPAIYVEVLNSRALLEPIVRDSFVVGEERDRRAALLDLLKVRGATDPVRRAKGVIALRRIVVASEDKKLGAVKLTVSTRWPSVSLALAQRLVEGVNAYNLTTRRTLAAAERQFVDEQVVTSLQELRASEDVLQAFLVRNRVFVAPELAFERDRFERVERG